MATRSMVVALVPGAEALVGAHRARLDPTTRAGLGAHLTLVYPCVPPERITAGTADHLRAAVAPVGPVTCTFTHLEWFDDRVLWLAPHPVEPFVEIAGRVVDGVPGCPPAVRALVPHLTVGLRPHARPAELRDAADALTPALPLVTRIEAVQLMVRTERWETVAEARLGEVGPPGP